MTKLPILLLPLVAAALLLGACGELDTTEAPNPVSFVPAPPTSSGAVKPSGEPSHITVEHILIGVRRNADRSRKFLRDGVEAKKYAYALFEELKKQPAAWGGLKRTNSEDPGPGRYGMSNFGVQPGDKDIPRADMVDAFGDVGFKLKVGEIGMADFDLVKSKFGYHIIKRVE